MPQWPKWNPFGKTYIIKCPNGNEVTVFKSAKDALPLALDEYDVDLGTKANVPSGPSVELGASVKQRVKKTLFSIDKANRELAITFHYVYLVFQADPCNRGQYFESEVKKLI